MKNLRKNLAWAFWPAHAVTPVYIYDHVANVPGVGRVRYINVYVFGVRIVTVRRTL